MSTSVATSVDDELLRTRLTCFSLLHANHWHRCDTIFCSCYSTHSSGSRCPFPLAPCSCPCPSHILSGSGKTLLHSNQRYLFILDMLDMRATRSVVRVTTSEYDVKTNLNSVVEFPLCSRGLSSFNMLPDTFTSQPIPPQFHCQAIRIKQQAQLLYHA